MPLVTHSVGGFTLTCDAEAFTQYLRMVAAGMPMGGINSSYRDPLRQGVIFRQNYVHASNTTVARAQPLDRRYWPGHGWYERRRYATTGGRAVSVAVPGTSQHNFGLAIDFAYPQRVWVRDNGEPFGWVWPQWARRSSTYEPWHMEFDKTTAPPPDIAPPQEDDVELTDKVELTGQAARIIGADSQSVNGALANASAALTVAQHALAASQLAATRSGEALAVAQEVAKDTGHALRAAQIGSTRAGEALAATERIENALKNLSVNPAEIDYDRLAKAVNDDAARRMQE